MNNSEGWPQISLPFFAQLFYPNFKLRCGGRVLFTESRISRPPTGFASLIRGDVTSDDANPRGQTETAYIDLPDHRVRVPSKYFPQIRERLKPAEVVWLHAILNASYPQDGSDWVPVEFPRGWFGVPDAEIQQGIESMKRSGLVECQSPDRDRGRWRIHWPQLEKLPVLEAGGFPRLTEINATLPGKRASYTNAEAGYEVWQRRRRNAYIKALKSIRQAAALYDVPQMVLDFGTLVETLARLKPASLPRNYQWSVNSDGEPAIAWESHLLNAGLGDPYPPLEVALRFVADLERGWLDEVALILGLQGSFDLPGVIR